MRRAGLVSVLILASACAAPRGPASTAPSGVVPSPSQEPPEVKDPDFILSVSETVPNPGDDGISYTKVFADGKEAGKTAVGRRSEVRTLKLKLPPGNVLVRLEQWVLPGVGEWKRVDDALQPRERFVRVEDGTIARLELRFSDGEASNTLSLSRENAPR
jgi:hypothetical protein